MTPLELARVVRRRRPLRRFGRLGRRRAALGVRSDDSRNSAQRTLRRRAFTGRVGRVRCLGRRPRALPSSRGYRGDARAARPPGTRRRRRRLSLPNWCEGRREPVGRGNRRRSKLDRCRSSPTKPGASSRAAPPGRPTRSAPARNRRACATRCTARSTMRSPAPASDAEASFAAIVAGISGYNGTQRGRPPQLPSERVKLMHDAPIAHAGALGGRPGVVIIAGTGSVIYARDDGGAGVHARRLGISLRRRGQRVSHCRRRARGADARPRRRRRIASRGDGGGAGLLR